MIETIEVETEAATKEEVEADQTIDKKNTEEEAQVTQAEADNFVISFYFKNSTFQSYKIKKISYNSL